LHKIVGVTLSPAPYFDLQEEKQTQQTILKLIQQGLIRSAHDSAEGGLFTSLLESAKQRNLGFDLQLRDDLRADAFLFGEAQSRFVVSVKAGQEAAFEAALLGQAFEKLGTVNAGEVNVGGQSWGMVAEWANLYEAPLQEAMGK